MQHHGPTSWLLNLPILPHDSAFLHVNGAIVTFLVVTVFSFFAYLAIQKRGDDILPPSRFSFSGMVDLCLEMIHNLITGIMGHHGDEHFSFLGSIFIFVLFCNLLGLIPLGASPSTNLNTTYALGITSFLYYNVMGAKSHGVKNYLAHFWMKLGFWWLFPVSILILCVELFSHSLRAFTLGLRLFINLDVDHNLLTSFQDLVAWILPVPVLLFGLVVCTLQAFLFTVLSTVYIQMATEHE